MRAEQKKGGPQIERFRTQKTAALFAFLATHTARYHPREELIDRFWPDALPEEGRTSLRTALSSLRRQLAPPGTPMHSVLQADRFQVRLNPEAIATDTVRFTELLEAARHEASTNPSREITFLRAALALYQGPFLPGSYDLWAATLREHFATERHHALRRIAVLLLQAGSPAEAIEYARQAAENDPLDEEAQTDLIRVLAMANRTAEALRHYREWERLLHEEMDDSPSPETVALIERIRRGEDFTLTASIPTTDEAGRIPKAAPARDTITDLVSLPLRLDRFFGRQEEVAQLTARLRDPEIRLVTLLGPGGIGKTRLSLETAARIGASHFRGGVWFVPLAEVTEPARLLEAVRDALRLPRDVPLNPLDQIADALVDAPGVPGHLFLLGPNDQLVGDVYVPKGGFNVPQKRTPISRLQQKKVKSGAPPIALVQKLIQYLWEGQSDTYSTINVDLLSTQIGTPRLWTHSWSGGDLGTGVPGKTMVYPVKTRWTQRQYSASGVVITETEGVHNFYINAFNEWQCGLAESKEVKPMQTIPNP